MRSKKLLILEFLSINFTIICLIITILNIISLNWTNVILSGTICYLLYVNTVTLKRTINLIKGKDQNGN